MANILVLTNHIGGLHNFRKEVMKAIMDSGYNVYISKPDNDERGKYFEDIGCHIIQTNFDRRGMNPLADMNLLITYYKMIKRLKPKAVLTYTIKPNIYGGIACRLAGVPLLANVTGLGDALENGGWLQKLTIILYRLGLSHAHKIFCQNGYNKDFCERKRISRNNGHLLPGSGVNLEFNSYQPYPEDGIIKFLYMGRLIKDKGIDELFEMASYIKNKYPATEFQILGVCDKEYQNKLNSLIKDGIVIHNGYIMDVRESLGKVHCTIMPSYHEGMSNSNLESAANGRPIITTNVPGCKETVDDGKSGFIVKVHDTEDLINGVERFVLLPYSQKVLMSKNARDKMEREFDRKIVINAYLDALSEISN